MYRIFTFANESKQSLFIYKMIWWSKISSYLYTEKIKEKVMNNQNDIDYGKIYRPLHGLGF